VLRGAHVHRHLPSALPSCFQYTRFSMIASQAVTAGGTGAGAGGVGIGGRAVVECPYKFVVGTCGIRQASHPT